MAVANTGVYRFQIRFNFLRHPDGTCTEHTGPVDAVAAATPTPGNSVFSIKWKRGAKQGNKGVVGPVARYSRPGGKGDYIFNAVVETEVNMRRKDEKDEGKGFAVKTLELAVKEHSLDESSGAVKIKTVFECDFNLASAMPPTKDISPHMMLRRAMGSQKEVSLSVSVGYRFLRKIDSEGGASRFGLCSAAGAARPSAPGQPRSQAAPWWSCGGAPASAAPDARGRDANGALKRRSMSADAAQSWWRCSGPASAPPQGTRPVRAGDDAADRGDVPRRVHFSDDIDTKFISSASLQRERGGRRGAGAGAPAEEGFGDGSDEESGAGEEDIEYLFVKGENGEADVAAGSDSDEEGGEEGAPPPERKRTVGDDLLSNSGQVGRGLGSGTIPLTPNLYTRRPSNSEKGAFMRSTQLPSKAAPKPRPGLLGRTRGTLKKSGGFTNGGGGQDSDGSPKAVETVCNKDVFFHEIDVRPMKRGVSYANRYTSTDSDVALFARGLMGSLDVFSSISDMEVRPDHQTEVELGGLSIPRLWMLLWGMHTDFVPSLHILAKDKNVRRSNWDINDDNDRALKYVALPFLQHVIYTCVLSQVVRQPVQHVDGSGQKEAFWKADAGHRRCLLLCVQVRGMFDCSCC